MKLCVRTKCEIRIMRRKIVNYNDIGRECDKCHNFLDWNKFNKRACGFNGKNNVCRACMKIYNDERAEKLNKKFEQMRKINEEKRNTAIQNRENHTRLSHNYWIGGGTEIHDTQRPASFIKFSK